MTTDDQSVTIRFSARLTTSPRNIPPPTQGSTEILKKLDVLLKAGTCIVNTDAIHTICLSQSNPDESEIFKPRLIRCLDKDGKLLETRKFKILEQAGPQSRFLLVISFKPSNEWKLVGSFPNIDTAITIGQLWENSEINFDIDELPSVTPPNPT